MSMSEDFGIYITTRERSDHQPFLMSLPKVFSRIHVYLVVYKYEAEKYEKYRDRVREILVYSSEEHLAKLRQWVVTMTRTRYFCLCDDDIVVKVRKEHGELATRSATKLEIVHLFVQLYTWHLEGFAQTGVSVAEFNRFEESEVVDNTRMLRIMSFDVHVLRREELKFDDIQLMSDYHMILSLLERGYENRVTFYYTNAQGKSNAEGGCSLYRTPELMEQCARRLKELHPQTVRLQENKPTNWPGFNGTRTDVSMKWKEAIKIGKRKKTGISSLL